jgi:hypothetical protein
MEIYEALPHVHFRLSETGHLIRCCGDCGASLPNDAEDPCLDDRACGRRKQVRLEAGASAEPVPAAALLEEDVLLRS